MFDFIQYTKSFKLVLKYLIFFKSFFLKKHWTMLRNPIAAFLNMPRVRQPWLLFLYDMIPLHTFKYRSLKQIAFQIIAFRVLSFMNRSIVIMLRAELFKSEGYQHCPFRPFWRINLKSWSRQILGSWANTKHLIGTTSLFIKINYWSNLIFQSTLFITIPRSTTPR